MNADTQSATGRVAGKIALVTGAASGIGQATATTLARQGAVVVCCDLNLAGAEQTVASIIDFGGQSSAHHLDITEETAWQATLEQLLREFGRLDITVNCAGISFASQVEETNLDDWRRVMSVNLEGVFLGTKHSIRAMRQANCAGSIVNVSSVSGIKAQAGAAAYCASKAAVIMFSQVAAAECRQNGDNIRVNSVSPTGVKTPMWKTMPFFQELMKQEGGEEEAFRAMAGSSENNRWALPEEVALCILYLASDESSFVTGTNVVFDNGDAT